MKEGRGKKVVVAMSGGVDSSVAAALLVERGYEVVGCFMRLGSEEGKPMADCRWPTDAEIVPAATNSTGENAANRQSSRGCCSVGDAADARLVAARLGVPFYVLNFREDFGRIMDYFAAEYHAGRTPNPCVRCNDWLKFGRLVRYAQSIDADGVATGHYARIGRDGADRATLLRGLDEKKDQSYVLFGVGRSVLERMLLPIGEYPKERVRAMARERGLPTFDKPDSQEICFVPDDDYAGLIERRTPGRMERGALLDRDGRVIGEHDGHQRFTVGQRRRLGVAMGYPLYVIERDAGANTVRLGRAEDLLAGGLQAGEVNWLGDRPADGEEVRCLARVRSNGELVGATLRLSGSGPGAGASAGEEPGGPTLEVRFDSPMRAVTPGQAVVCYEGDRVLCGGWIRRALRE